jgi:hypothetical protein
MHCRSVFLCSDDVTVEERSHGRDMLLERLWTAELD